MEQDDKVLNRLHEIVFTTRMNIIYHEDSEAFFRNIVNITTFLSLISSSIAFAAIGKVISSSPETNAAIIALVSLFVAILNGLVLAYGMNAKATLHADLKKKWIEIIKDIELLENNERITFNEIDNKINTIHSSEPAPYKKRLIKSYNKAKIALGLDRQCCA
jgi:hypothetical protein